MRRQFLIFLLIFQAKFFLVNGSETIEHFLQRQVEVIRKKTTNELEAFDDQLLSESNVEAIVDENKFSKDPIECIGNLKYLLKNRLPFVLSSEASVKNYNATGSFIQIANKKKLVAKFTKLHHSKINRLVLRSVANIPVMSLNEKLIENNIAIGKITSSVNNAQGRAEDGDSDEGRLLKNLTVKHLTLNFAQHPFTDALIDSNSSLIFFGQKQLQNISTDHLLVTQNAINNILFDNFLHISRLKKGITGDKILQTATVSELILDGVFNNIPKSFFKTSEEKKLNESKKIDFHGDINVKNLKVQGIGQINVTAFMNDVLRNEKGKKLVLNGNLMHQNELKIGNLQADLIGRTFTNNFMTVNTDQVIAASTFINKFYSTTLKASSVNKELFSPSNIATVNSPNVIKPKTRFMDISIIRNLNVEEQARNNGAKKFMETIKRHIIGTETKDLIQIYNGRVTIKGSLSVQDVHFSSTQSAQVFVNNLLISQNIPENYWMKNVKQRITSPNFTINNDLLATAGVMVQNLNEYPMEKYLLLNNEKRQQTALIVKFEDAIVAGDVKGHRNNMPSFIFTLNNNVVPRNSIVPVNIVGNVEFRNELLIQKLRTGAINNQEVTSLVNKNHLVILMEAPISVSGLDIKKNLIVERDFLVINTYNNIDLQQFSENAFKLSQDGINIDSIILNDFDASNLTVITFEGKNFDAMMKRFEEEFASPNSADRMRSISIHGDLTLKSNVFVERINSENINELLNSLALKSNGGVLSIGGRKSFEGDAKSKILVAKKINSLSANRLLHRSLSKSEKQILREELFVTQLKVKSLHTNVLNEYKWDEFVSKKDLGKPLFINLHLNEIIVGDLTSSFSSFDLNLLMQSALFPKRNNWNYINVANASSVVFSKTALLQQLFDYGIDKTSSQEIHGYVSIQNTPKFFMKSVTKPTLELSLLNYKSINLFELINDSVKNNQPQPEIIRGVKTLQKESRFDSTNLIIGNKCNFYARYINDIEVNELDQTIFRKNDLNVLNAAKSFNYLHVDEFEIAEGKINGIFMGEIVTPYAKLEKILFANLESEEITTYSINGFSLPYFLQMRLRKFGPSQDIISSIAMKSAHFETKENLFIPIINDVELDQCMFSVSDQHQEFLPHLIIAGRATFVGPAHINKINGEEFEKFILNSVSRHKRFSPRHLSLQNVELKNGLKILHIINDREIQELLNSGAHSPKLQDLLALISYVQKQEMAVDNMKMLRSNLRPRIMYLDTDNNINTQYSILQSQFNEENCNSQNEIHVAPHARGFVVSPKNNFNFELPSMEIQVALTCNENKMEIKWSFKDGQEKIVFNQSLEIIHKGSITSEDIFVMKSMNGHIFLLIRITTNIVSIRLDKKANKWINFMDNEISALKNHVRIMSIVQNVHQEIYLVASLMSNDDVLIFKYDDLKGEFLAAQKIPSTTKYNIIRSVQLKNLSTFLIFAQSNARKIIIYRLQHDKFVFQQIIDEIREDIVDVTILHISEEPFIVLSMKSGTFCFYQWRGVENWQSKQCGKFENLKHMKSFDFLNKQRIFLASSIESNAQNSVNALVIHRQGETF